MKLVVVGNGMVGHRLVETLRARDARGGCDITVLAEESRPAYDRVRLSAWFDGEALELSCVDGVTVRLGEAATALDPAARTVTTAVASYSYDALVLATGSSPFVPPVPGCDLTGCFVYRTVDDLHALSAYAQAGSGPMTGVVVGGGLLGLEAANALRRLGVNAHVVELAPRLMPLQVDEAGGAMLRRHIEELGLTIHTGRMLQRVDGRSGRVSRVVFADGGVLSTDVVVFAAGVRPRDDLARAAGLTVGARGGVVVDHAGRTSAPDIYAVGECAEIGGRVYGLVAPGYAMAEMVADRLLGGDATFEGADTSTKLKLLGVDVASFGSTAGPLDVTFTDPATRVYAKLVLSDDAKTLLGGILVGDASAYATLRAQVGLPLLSTPLALLAPAGDGGVGANLPDTAQVCSCNAVTKATIVSAITGQGCADVAAVKECTRAGTTCGSCVPLLKQLLTESGVAMPTALCEHFDLSRQELFDLMRVRGITTFSQLIGEHGRGRGCESASRWWPRSWPASPVGTFWTVSRRPCRTPMTTSWPTCSATVPTRSCRGSPAVRSPRRSSSSSARWPGTSSSTRRSPAASGSTCSARGWNTCPRSGAGWSMPASSPGTRTARRCGR